MEWIQTIQQDYARRHSVWLEPKTLPHTITAESVVDSILHLLPHMTTTQYDKYTIIEPCVAFVPQRHDTIVFKRQLVVDTHEPWWILVDRHTQTPYIICQYLKPSAVAHLSAIAALLPPTQTVVIENDPEHLLTPCIPEIERHLNQFEPDTYNIRIPRSLPATAFLLKLAGFNARLLNANTIGIETHPHILYHKTDDKGIILVFYGTMPWHPEPTLWVLESPSGKYTPYETLSLPQRIIIAEHIMHNYPPPQSSATI